MTNPSKLNTLVTITTNPQSPNALTLGIAAGDALRKGFPASGYRLQAAGGTGGYVYAFVAGFGTLPPGMVVNADGTMTGTPTTIGTFSFRCQVQDSSSTIDPATFTLRVIGRLSILWGTPPNGESGIAYQYAFGVAGATGTVSFAVVAGAIPVTFTLSSAGVLSGVPSVVLYTVYYATVRATDSGSGDTIDIPVSFGVYPSLSINVTNLPPQIVGTYYEFAIPVSGGTGAYVYSVDPSTTLSDGMTLTAGGVLSGVIPTPLSPVGMTVAFRLNIADGIGTRTQLLFRLLSNPLLSSNNLSDVGSAVTARNNIGAGTVSGVTASPPIVSSGGINPIISHAVSGAGTGTFGRMTIDAYGHTTAGGYEYTTIFSKAVAGSLNYDHSDFTGLTTLTDVVRLSGAAGGASAFRGFFPTPRAGQFVLLFNASTTTITLNNEDAGETTAASRFAIGANFAIAAGHSAQLWYDTASSRWRIAASY